jgi:hypothetical protein
VVVAARADGTWQDDASCVQTLPHLVKVADAGDLFDENRCEALAAQLLVHAKEVDLGAEDDLVSDTEMDGDCGDESNELARLSSANTNVVTLLPARRHHGPWDEVRK